LKGEQLLELLLRFFDAYGLLVVFTGALLENTLFVGLVIPGEAIVLLAAFAASQGQFNVVLVALIAFVGAFLGANISFAIGLKGGRPFIERYGEKLGISHARIDAAESYFDQHGAHTVVVTRFTAGVKNFVPALAGASHMKYYIFLGYLTVGLILWVVTFTALGYFFGSNFDLLMRLVGGFGWAVLVLLAAIVIFLVYRRHRKRR